LPVYGPTGLYLWNGAHKIPCTIFSTGLLAYLEVVGITPSQPVEEIRAAGLATVAGTVDPGLIEELWQTSDAAAYGMERGAFAEILLKAGSAQNYGFNEGTSASRQQQASFFSSLRLNDLVLARACASGHERAWEHFLALYHHPLQRAAIAIANSETVGRDLADSLYAELYGLTSRDGERRCPLDSYRGRGSLIGWLRTTLAQRHMDHYRRTRREQPMNESGDFDAPAKESEPAQPPGELALLGKAVEEALLRQPADDRFLLTAYYLDGRTLLQIGKLLGVHEATVSRKLRRVTGELRKQILRSLAGLGMSRRAPEETLAADPRDLDLNLKKLLQNSRSDAFQEKAAP
jgi:RNA polymerase sigma-70 factor (ECF subfamily)